MQHFDDNVRGHAQCPFCYGGIVVYGKDSNTYFCNSCYKNIKVRVENNL